jgi:cytochrome P450
MLGLGPLFETTLLSRLRARLHRQPSPAPGGDAGTINLDDPAVADDPFPHYERLRAGGPVQFLRRHEAWIVLGHPELQTVFARPDLFSNRPYEDVDAVLLAADPPDHTAIRHLVAPYFRREVIERLAAFAAARAAALLAPRLDIVRDFAEPLSEAVAQQLLGCDDATVTAIRAAAVHAASFEQFTTALDGLADRTDIYARLRADGLGDAQARSLVRLFWIASTKTTERTIAQSILQLLLHPEIRAAVAADDRLIGPYIEEVMRLHQPEPMLRRRSTQAVPLGGALIPADAMVLLCLTAANRDPRAYEAPAELRLERAQPRHLTFGHGIHHCIGAMLGRAEVSAAVRALLRQAPQFRAAQPLDRVPYVANMMCHHIGHFVIDTGLGAGDGSR